MLKAYLSRKDAGGKIYHLRKREENGEIHTYGSRKMKKIGREKIYERGQLEEVINSQREEKRTS